MIVNVQPAATPDGEIIYPLASIMEQLDMGRLFPVPQPLEVELGAGDGGFLLQWAGLHPEVNFIGVERLLGRLRKIDKKGRRAGRRNLRAIRLEASYFVKYLLPPASVQALHIYFPDPWPKRRHWRRRLINEPFTEIAAQALQPAGKVFIRTDDPSYFAQINRVFGANNRFRSVETPPELSAVLTDFEREFHARGISTNRAAFELA